LTDLHRAASMGRTRCEDIPMRARAGLLVASLALALGGCARARAIPRVALTPPRAASLEQVLAAYDGYCKGMETLSASGDLDVRDLRAGKARKLGVRLVARRGGRLYLKGSVAVVTALEVVSDGARFWFQVPSKKTVWTGAAAEAAPRAAETEDAPYYALRPADVTSALLPEPLAPDATETVILEADRETFSLSLARLEGGRGHVRRRVWLDRQTLRPSRLSTYDERGDIRTEARLSGWTPTGPQRVDIARPLDGYEAAFSFDRVESNVPVAERAFSPRTPPEYTVVEVGK
jgi:outer membrane lipoprotein-sorting protein